MKKHAASLLVAAAAGLATILHPIRACADTIYVWSYDGAITKLTEDGVGTAFANTGSSFNGSVGLALDNLGNLYAGNPSNSTVTKFTPNGAATFFAIADSISGLAFNNTGVLYGTSPNFNALVRFQPSGGVGVDITDYAHHKLNYPTSIAFDPAGNLYAANHGNSFFGSQYANTIEKFSPAGIDLGTFASGFWLDEPWGLAFDGMGNLFVSNSGDNTILGYTPGGSLWFYANTGLDDPQGLAFDSAGNLYVANAGNNTIMKFDPEGNGTVFASGLNSPSSIAIQRGVPEPSTFILLAVGLSILPGLARRRRK